MGRHTTRTIKAIVRFLESMEVQQQEIISQNKMVKYVNKTVITLGSPAQDSYSLQLQTFLYEEHQKIKTWKSIDRFKKTDKCALYKQDYQVLQLANINDNQRLFTQCKSHFGKILKLPNLHIQRKCQRSSECI